MKRLALVALPLVVVGFALVAVVLVARRRREWASTEPAIGETEAVDRDLVDAGRTPDAGIDVLSGYDEEHESEIEARHGATLHIPEDRLSVRQV